MSQQPVLNASDLPSFRWVKSDFPIFLRSAGFFFYAALILFFGFDIIPNFLPVSDTVFNVGGIAVIFLLDFIYTRFLSRQKPLGTIHFDAGRIRVISADGTDDRELAYEQIRNLTVYEGVPLSLFYYLAESKTVMLEIVLKDLKNIKLECIKKSDHENAANLEQVVDFLQDRIGLSAQQARKRKG
jgi:hypothetical protein